MPVYYAKLLQPFHGEPKGTKVEVKIVKSEESEQEYDYYILTGVVSPDLKQQDIKIEKPQELIKFVDHLPPIEMRQREKDLPHF